MNLDLIVIKTLFPEKLVECYSLLGIKFEYHNHGNGPFHYAGKINETIFEIYPLPKNITSADNTLRLGLSLKKLDNTFEKLRDSGIKIIKEPHLTEWGYKALIEDLDGRKIELTDSDIVVSKYQIQDSFKVTGRGIVFSGISISGEIQIGDEIKFTVNDVSRIRRIKGIDGFRKLPMQEPINIGLMIQCDSLSEIDELKQWSPNGEIALIKHTKNQQ